MEGGEMKFEEKLKEEILEELDKKGFIGNEYENPNEEVTIDLVMEKYKQRVREVIDKWKLKDNFKEGVLNETYIKCAWVIISFKDYLKKELGL